MFSNIPGYEQNPVVILTDHLISTVGNNSYIHMPGTFPGALKMWIHLHFTTMVWYWYYNYAHFTDEETNTQRGKVTSSRLHN